MLADELEIALFSAIRNPNGDPNKINHLLDMILHFHAHASLEEKPLAPTLYPTLNARNPSYQTPLMVAVLHRNVYAVEALIKAGVKLDLQDLSGKTALMHAVLAVNDTLVFILVKAGANLEMQCRHKKSVLDYAIDISTDESLPILNCLLENNAVIQNPNRLERFLLSFNQADTRVKFSRGILKNQFGHRNANAFFEDAKKHYHAAAIRRLADNYVYSSTFDAAINHYCYALRLGDALALNRLVILMRQLCQLQATKQECYLALYQAAADFVYAYLDNQGWQAELETAQWIFLAEDALGNTYFNRSEKTPHSKMRFILDASHQAVTAAKTVTEKADAENCVAKMKEIVSQEKKRIQDSFQYCQLAISHASGNQFVQAESYFAKAIHLNPINPDAYRMRAEMRLRMGNFRDAIADYDVLIGWYPSDMELRLQRGSANLKAKEFNVAIADLDQVIATCPSYFEALHLRGKAKTQLRQFEAAIADYNLYMAFNPYDCDALYEDRAYAKYMKDDFEGAMIDYNTAILLNPSNTKAHFYHNRVFQLLLDEINLKTKEYYKKEDFDAMIAEYNKLIRLTPPESSNVYCLRGVCKRHKKDLAGAIKDFNQSISCHPTINAFYERGMAFYLSGQYRLSLNDIDVLLDMLAAKKAELPTQITLIKDTELLLKNIQIRAPSTTQLKELPQIKSKLCLLFAAVKQKPKAANNYRAINASP